MYLTIDDLMDKVNCTKFPERWREIYDDAMRGFYANGCPLTNPAYYDEIGDRYNILTKYRAVYKKAAEEVGKDEYLSAFLELLCFALKDRNNVVREIVNEFVAPTVLGGGHCLAVDMLTGLAMCSLMPYSYENLKKRNFPKETVDYVMQSYEKGVDEYRKRNDGAYGYHLLGWFQIAADGRLFRINCLEIELLPNFETNAVVFVNENGESVAFADNLQLHRSGFPLGAKNFEDAKASWTADICETPDEWKGYPFDDKGFVSKKQVSLPKGKWRKALSSGDGVINLHIPAGVAFTEEALDQSVVAARRFLKDYFPDFDYKAFVCYSWLLDSQLEMLLGENSNIVRFGKRFRKISSKSDGTDVFYFVFNKPFGTIPEICTLPENSRLERALKKHYSEGNVIYETAGYFF